MRSQAYLILFGLVCLGLVLVDRPSRQPPASVTNGIPTDPVGETREQLVKLCRECRFIVLGRVTQVESVIHPRSPLGRTVALGTIQVQRHLKDITDLEVLPVEFRFESTIEMRSDEGEDIWFVRDRQEGGRYLVTDWKWGPDSLDLILEAISRVD
jgi:hypothetical protein